MSRGIEAGKAFVSLLLDDSPLNQGIKRAQGRLRGIARTSTQVGGALLGAGGALAAPIIAAVSKFAKLGDEMHKMALRTGISAKQLSRWSHALELSGTNIDTFERGIRNMQKSLFDAEQGLKTPTVALSELGLELKDLAGLKPDEQFQKIAERIGQVEDPSRQAALAFKVFGKSGTELLPLIKSGAEGMAAMRDEADKLGVTMSEEDAQAAADFTDAMQRLKTSLFGAGAAISSAVLPQLISMIEWVTSTITTVAAWIKENKGLTVSVLAVGAVLSTVGAILVGVGLVASGAAAALGVLGTVAGLLASPFVLGAALALALGAAFLWATGAAGEIQAGFGDLIESMSRALQAGGIEAAWFAIWTSLAAIANEAIASILESFAELVESITKNQVLRIALNIPTLGIGGAAGDAVSGGLRDKASSLRSEAGFIRTGRDSVIGGLEAQNASQAELERIKKEQEGAAKAGVSLQEFRQSAFKDRENEQASEALGNLSEGVNFKEIVADALGDLQDLPQNQQTETQGQSDLDFVADTIRNSAADQTAAQKPDEVLAVLQEIRDIEDNILGEVRIAGGYN